MDNLLLKIRLEALKNSLTKIQSIFEWVEERRGELNKLIENIEQAGQHLNAVSFHVNSLRNFATPPFGPPKVDPSLVGLLDLTLTETANLIRVVNDAKNNIERIRMHRPAIDKNFAEAVKDDLDEITREWFKTINENLEALSGEAKGTNEALDKAWQDYTGILSENLRLFFSEYVQFLGGLALRDAGLDAGICRIADDLIRSCGAIGKTNWNAMTLPASQEAVTLAQSIRVGFPEWTIWALPLAAHELGQVAITGNTVWEKYIALETKKYKKGKDRDKIERHMRVCLADAFATCAMGPAYACSAILLRLNPLSAYNDSANYPADAKRAHVILTMLKMMRAQDPNVVPPYSEIIDLLEKGWNAALARAKPAGALSVQEQDQLNSWTQEMFNALSKKPARGLYDGKLWKSTRAALENLLKGEPAGDLKGTEEWRDVLNAAWACRAADVDESGAIDQKAQELWKLIEVKQQEKQASKPEAYARPGGEAIPSTKGEIKPWPKAAT